MEVVTNPVRLPSAYWLQGIPCYLILHKNASFLTRLAPLISPSFSSITFQNVPATSDLRNILSEVSRFRHHTKLLQMYCFVSFCLKFKPHLLKKSLLVECCFCHGNPRLNFRCTTCIICYHATQTAEIFPNLQLFLIYPKGHSGWLRCDSHCLRTAFLKLWSAEHKWSSGSALVVLSD